MGLIEIARFNNRAEAELARLCLGGEGIDAILFDTESQFLNGGLFVPVRLMALDEDSDAAQRVLAEEGFL